MKFVHAKSDPRCVKTLIKLVHQRIYTFNLFKELTFVLFMMSEALIHTS